MNNLFLVAVASLGIVLTLNATEQAHKFLQLDAEALAGIV